ncbi:hypothetical protein QQF64_034180 [Cirrhinus molitorella]|uniref:Uncharacterized protein n=1 Tax=Cirrhinus molitorella TaxID=172907 RepID=A0ABR3MW06_9TELE
MPGSCTTGHQGSSVDGLSLKNFRIQVFRSCSSQSPAMFSPSKSSSFPSGPSTSADVPKSVRGHRSPTPDDSVRFDMSLFHAPVPTPPNRPASTAAGRGTY